MSLFKARDYWSCTCGTEESFSSRGLASAKFGGGEDGQSYLLVGSFEGVLRVYQPKGRGYQPDDVLLEMKMDEPILQVGVGLFLPSSGQEAVAILHPKRIIVYQWVAQGPGELENNPLSNHHNLAKQYEHKFERTMYNFCFGPFGFTHGKDFLCCQSMDGQLQFFEHDRLLCSRFLHNFLVPGSIQYLAKSDSFITHTSTFEVECYSYRQLTSSSGSEEKTRDQPEGKVDPNGGKKIQVEWSYNIGEEVSDLFIAKLSTSGSAQQDIVVLGERTLVVLNQGGGCRFQKRLDYFTICGCVYPVGTDHSNLIIGTANKSLQVIEEGKVAWAATTNHQATSLLVGGFAKVQGMVAMLTSDGRLSVNYLGTDAATTQVQLLESKELDYDEMDAEHRRLQSVIRQAVNSGKKEPKHQLKITANTPKMLDSDSDSGELGGSSNKPSPYCTTVGLTLFYPGSDDLENVWVSVSVPAPFMLDETSIALPTVHGQREANVSLQFYLPTDCTLLPTSLTTTVTAAYASPQGEPLTSKLTFMLPMAIAGAIIPPVKNSTYKITLEINREMPPLASLFDDVPGSASQLKSAPTALSFQYYNTSLDATILVSKQAARYRLQSASFEALWLLTSELVRRLKGHFANEKTDSEEYEQNGPFQISYRDQNLPFQEYFVAIDKHFASRNELATAHQTLAERAHQFRAIQKRLLVRFKDRNPSPLQNLDTLFSQTYESLITIAEEVEGHQQNLVQSSNSLACATNLMLVLIRYTLQMQKEEFAILRHHLSPVVVDTTTQGWEECCDAAMTHLLRTCLAKNAKESSSQPQPLATNIDVSKLKKHIALVCDRLSKGGSLRMEGKKPKN